MAERSWLQSTYAWDAAALEARPAQQTKETATSQPRRAAAVCQVRRRLPQSGRAVVMWFGAWAAEEPARGSRRTASCLCGSRVAACALLPGPPAVATHVAACALGEQRTYPCRQPLARCPQQVEGCGADLTHLRYFFRKQRICGGCCVLRAAAALVVCASDTNVPLLLRTVQSYLWGVPRTTQTKLSLLQACPACCAMQASCSGGHIKPPSRCNSSPVNPPLCPLPALANCRAPCACRCGD